MARKRVLALDHDIRGEFALSDREIGFPWLIIMTFPEVCTGQIPACLNTSSLEHLQDLPGIGPAYAEAILGGRKWASLHDLTAVSGIVVGTVDNIQESELVCDDLLWL